MLAQLGKTVADEPGAEARRRLPAADPDGGRLVVRPLGHELRLWHLVGAVRAERRRRRHGDPAMRKAADWLVRIQNADGGWGEDGESYKLDYKAYEPAAEHCVTDGMVLACV